MNNQPSSAKQYNRNTLIAIVAATALSAGVMHTTQITTQESAKSAIEEINDVGSFYLNANLLISTKLKF